MMGCVTKGSYGTETVQAKCDVLRNALPSYSVRDTDQTKQEGLIFLMLFDTHCPPTVK